ncbi:cobalamin biosynthesis protein CbiX [Streptomyces sp. NBC_00247]|uniref:cobalamin biosynthesis protein CbiX n=1 Tax=Streptomyces sp. NBC_00247 TaxID=2975689 RepID=UPI003FA7DD71
MQDDCRVVAVCGHETAYGEALRDLEALGVVVVSSGRELYRAVAGPGPGPEQLCVVPMTLGRDPRLVADSARTLRALPTGEGSRKPRALLAEPFGTTTHLIAWLRAAARRVPVTSALLVTAPAGDPFDDAELYRVASLVQRNGHHCLVEVAFTGGEPDTAEGVRRCLLLGADRVVLLPAAFAAPEAPPVPDAADRPGARIECAGPPVSRAALTRVLAERVADARRRWNERADDGITAGLAAADDHGHGHTHPPGEGHDHGHGHDHEHDHAHTHDQAHDHEHDHAHPPGEGHEHGHAHSHMHRHPSGEEHEHPHSHRDPHHHHHDDHSHSNPRPHPHVIVEGADRAVRSSV